MVSARPTRLDTFSAWVGITAKSAMASQAARGGMQRRAKVQPSSTRARYQSKEERWKASADPPNRRWSIANESVAIGRYEGGSRSAGRPRRTA